MAYEKRRGLLVILIILLLIAIIKLIEPANAILGNLLPQIMALVALGYLIYMFRTEKAARIFGLLVGIGGILNLIAVSANNGFMPAIAYERLVAEGGNYPYNTSMEGARLVWLCDWIGGHASIGDIFIVTGAVISTVFILEMLYQRRKAKQ